MLIKSSAQASLFKLLIFTLIFNAIPLPDYMLVFMPIWILMFLSQWLVINKNEGIYFIALLIGLLIDIQLSDILERRVPSFPYPECALVALGWSVIHTKLLEAHRAVH